jgi:hypothetical protein
MYMASVGWCWMMKNDGDNEGRDAVGDLLFWSGTNNHGRSASADSL